MRVHRHFTLFALLAAAGIGGLVSGAHAQDYQEYPLETRVWMDRGHEPVLQRGESVRLYYRVSEDAFVAIFHIDTNGTARMVFPTSPQENHFARGGRDYRVLFPGSTYWYVNEDPGMGYFFAVASPEPFNFSDLRYSHYDGGWDLSFVGRQVYRDPYLAMDDYVAALVPDWEYVPYGLDFTAYHVEQRYDYPRFMCYDCHGFRPYNAWNPYHYSCASFRVVIYNDPYYYPVSRYRGTRVVYVQPRRGVAHFGFKERAVGEAGTPQIVVRNSPAVSQPGVAGTETRRAQPRAGIPSNSSVTGSGAAVRRGSSGSGTPSVGERRPSSGAVTRLTPPSAGAPSNRRGGTPETVPLSSSRPGSGGVSSGVRRLTDPARPGATTPPANPSGRPVLERRPATGSSAVPRTAPPGSAKTLTRPSAKVRKGGGGTRVTSGGSTPPSARSGGSTRAIRPTTGSGGGSTRAIRPTRGSGGTSSRTIRPTTGSSRTGGRAILPTGRRNGGSATSARPTVRPGASSRGTAVKPRGGSSRPTVRGGGSSRTSPPAASRRPPVKRKKPGGGGGTSP